MKRELKPLINLIDKANKYIEQANENGYKVRVKCYGSSINTIHGITLLKFSKDFVELKGRNVAPKAIKSFLERITLELTLLGNEGYHIIVQSNRSDDYDVIVVKEVYMILYRSDLRNL